MDRISLTLPLKIMKRLLVTGASGFLGWHCCHAEDSNWRIYATSTSSGKIEPKNITKIQLDLTDENWMWSVIKEIKPDRSPRKQQQLKDTDCGDTIHPPGLQKIPCI